MRCRTGSEDALSTSVRALPQSKLAACAIDIMQQLINATIGGTIFIDMPMITTYR
jgi:hypothetical protein